MGTRNELRDAYKNGSLSRKEYWSLMAPQHEVLREYQALIKGTRVSSVEIRTDELRVVTDEQIAMIWDPSDFSTVPNILVDEGDYEPSESAALLRAARGAHAIFDVGANIGYYSLHWVSRLAPGGMIHAFEPVPSTYSWLQRNVAANDLGGRIRLNNFGLGDQVKGATIYFPKASGAGAASTMQLHPEEQTDNIDVLLSTIDRYFTASNLKHLDLIKADVEGAELFVIKGGLETICRTKPLIFLELLRKWSKPFGYHPNDVITLLGELGYKCYTFDHGELVAFEVMDDATVQTNFFFAHPDRHGPWLKENGQK